MRKVIIVTLIVAGILVLYIWIANLIISYRLDTVIVEILKQSVGL